MPWTGSASATGTDPQRVPSIPSAHRGKKIADRWLKDPAFTWIRQGEKKKKTKRWQRSWQPFSHCLSQVFPTVLEGTPAPLCCAILGCRSTRHECFVRRCSDHTRSFHITGIYDLTVYICMSYSSSRAAVRNRLVATPNPNLSLRKRASVINDNLLSSSESTTHAREHNTNQQYVLISSLTLPSTPSQPREEFLNTSVKTTRFHLPHYLNSRPEKLHNQFQVIPKKHLITT